MYFFVWGWLVLNVTMCAVVDVEPVYRKRRRRCLVDRTLGVGTVQHMYMFNISVEHGRTHSDLRLITYNQQLF